MSLCSCPFNTPNVIKCKIFSIPLVLVEEANPQHPSSIYVTYPFLTFIIYHNTKAWSNVTIEHLNKPLVFYYTAFLQTHYISFIWRNDKKIFQFLPYIQEHRTSSSKRKFYSFANRNNKNHIINGNVMQDLTAL